MFECWRQENFFKYMREEFLLDALVDYHIEPGDRPALSPQSRTPYLGSRDPFGPRRSRQARTRTRCCCRSQRRQRRPTTRGFKIAHARLGHESRKARSSSSSAAIFPSARKSTTSTNAPWPLATKRKHLTDIIKMIAYQTESDLLALLAPHYARADQEGRTLLHELFATTPYAPTMATHTSPWLRSVRRIEPIPPKPSPNCPTKMATVLPRQALPLCFAVNRQPRIGLAFPGSPVERPPPWLWSPDRR
jgi:hypothetical protein